jgi:DeoR/GlpR family transcriptional regulator of sugar metabolism
MTPSGPADRVPTPPDDRPVFGEERRRQILELVEAQGRVRVRDLAALIGVTETTVRKDIADLDRGRLLRRTHGGAIALQPSYEPDVTEREDRNSSAKEAIARACLAEIADGDAVFLDSGTSTAAIAQLFRDPAARVDGLRIPMNVNVLTNAMSVATTLSSVATVRHTVLGGQYRPLGGCFVGPLAIESLEQFTLNLAFIGVSGIDQAGLWVADTSEAQIKRAAMNQARRVIVPMDSTKFGVSDFVRVVDLDRIDTVITDRDNPLLRKLCDASRVELKIAD